jgi:hypothetical protein
MRIAFPVLAAVIVSACGGNSMTSPTAPAGLAATDAWAARGAVHDTIGRPITGARVEVQDGPQRGLAVLTNEDGNFAFESTFQTAFRARASKAGYREQSLSIGASNPGWFHLDSVNGSLSFSGSYTLAFAADSACTSIPSYARRRTYEAAVGASSGTTLVTLAGGGYGGTAAGGYFNNVLYAGVFEDLLRLYMSDPPVLERFPQGSYLLIAGQADGSIGQLPATVPVRGSFAYCAESAPGPDPRCAVTEITCQSSNHQLTVARR